MMRKLRRFVILTCLVFAVVAVAGEVLLQCMGLGHPLLVTTNSPANYEFAPNQHLHRTWPLSNSLISWVSTNQYGMRSPRVHPTPLPGTLRVYFLGDSIPYGTTQVSQSQIFVSLVANKLPSILREPVQALNGSCSGWAISNELAYLKEHGTLGSNRIILVLNDEDPMQPVSPTPTGEGIPSLKIHPDFGYQELWDRGLQPRAYKKLIAWHLMSGHAPNILNPGDIVAQDMTALKLNLRDLTLMQQYVRASGAHMSIVFISFPGDSSGDVLVNEGRHAIHEWAVQHDAPFLNLTPVLAKYSSKSIRLRGGVHLNVKGNAVVAAAILKNWSMLDPVSVSGNIEHAAK